MNRPVIGPDFWQSDLYRQLFPPLPPGANEPPKVCKGCGCCYALREWDSDKQKYRQISKYCAVCRQRRCNGRVTAQV